MNIDRYYGGIIQDLEGFYINPMEIIINYPLVNHVFFGYSIPCIVKNCILLTTSACGICYKHHPIQKVDDYPCWIQKSYINVNTSDID